MINNFLNDIIRFRATLWKMTAAQLRSRYAGSLMGIFLAVVNPLLMAAVITFVFSKVFLSPTEDFVFFALAGIIPWMFFSNALTEAAGSVLSQKNVLRQFTFPRALLPLSCVGAHFLNFLIGWAVILPIFLMHSLKVIALLPVLAAVLSLQVLFVVGLSLALSALNVLFRDIGHLMGMVLMFWFWMTPVFYSMDMVPAGFQWIYQVNPMVPFIEMYQSVLFEISLPTFDMCIRSLAWSFGALGGGVVVFYRVESRFLKEI